MAAVIWSGGAGSLVAIFVFLLGVAAGGIAGWLVGRDRRIRKDQEAERQQKARDAELRRLRESVRESRSVQAGLLAALETMRKGLEDSETRLAAAERAAREAEGGKAGAKAGAAPALPGGEEPVAPVALVEPAGGMADDLRRIAGIGPHLESVLHELGIFHYAQIAAWTPGEAAYVERYIAAAGGVVAGENWIGQARDILRREAPEFSNAVDDAEGY